MHAISSHLFHHHHRPTTAHLETQHQYVRYSHLTHMHSRSTSKPRDTWYGLWFIQLYQKGRKESEYACIQATLAMMCDAW